MKGRIQQESSSSEDALGGTERCRYANAQSSMAQTKPGVQRKHKPICRFYVSSSCKFGSQCKFYHPRPRCSPTLVNKEGDGQEKGDVNSERVPTDLSLGMFMGAVKSRPPVARPERVKCRTSADLLQVELEQLVARFPEDKHKIVEKGKHGVVYRITFAPADPDWTFDFKTVDLIVNFPNEYPTKPLSITVSDDQAMPWECISSINSAIADWLVDQVSGALILRPFLHWLDKVITMLVKDSFPEDVDTTPTHVVDDDANEDDNVTAEGDEGYEELETSELPAENIPPTVAAKRGTEIRLKDLMLGQYVATAIFPMMKLVAKCTRCKHTQDMTVTAEGSVSKACSRCHASMSVTFHSCLIHAGSITLGYMDLLGCVAVDIILMHSNVTITCLECGRENTTQGFCYGQSKDVWCRRCHSKLTMYAEQCKFVQHQPRELNRVTSEVPKQSKPKQKEPGLKVGSPLPEYGTCEHYKKSHRWLRFPCCGKAYPCDVCHDLREDHPMERANRMICGYCSQEQVYTASNPCVLCGFSLAVVRHSTFWEGGQGCRNKVKMSRNDKHKFSQSNKTSSKHSERVGLQGKKNKKINSDLFTFSLLNINFCHVLFTIIVHETIL